MNSRAPSCWPTSRAGTCSTGPRSQRSPARWRRSLVTMPLTNAVPTRQAPSFDAHEYHSRRTDYCVCVFVLNENGKLRKQLEQTQPYLDVADLVVADGGSTDGST